jgi:hypothetical protein
MNDRLLHSHKSADLLGVLAATEEAMAPDRATGIGPVALLDASTFDQLD